MCMWGARPRGCVGSSQHAGLTCVLPIPIQGFASPFGGEAPPQKPGGAGGLLPGAQWGWSVGWVLAGVAGWEPRGVPGGPSGWGKRSDSVFPKVRFKGSVSAASLP